MKPIPSSEITPEHLYRSRRRFLKGALIAAGGAALAACAPRQVYRPADSPLQMRPSLLRLP